MREVHKCAVVDKAHLCEKCVWCILSLVHEESGIMAHQPATRGQSKHCGTSFGSCLCLHAPFLAPLGMCGVVIMVGSIKASYRPKPLSRWRQTSDTFETQWKGKSWKWKQTNESAEPSLVGEQANDSKIQMAGWTDMNLQSAWEEADTETHSTYNGRHKLMGGKEGFSVRRIIVTVLSAGRVKEMHEHHSARARRPNPRRLKRL